MRGIFAILALLGSMAAVAAAAADSWATGHDPIGWLVIGAVVLFITAVVTIDD